MGAFFWDLQRAHGVSLLPGTGVASVEGRDHVEGVVTSDGRRLDADLVVVGIGVLPRTELAERAGLAVDRGVVVDSRLTTSDPHVLAAGDVANAFSPRYGRYLRVEHWETAKGQGRAAARTILGRGGEYDAVPFFYSDQYDVGMEFRGRIEGDERLVVRGVPADGAFVAFWLAGNRVSAAMNVNIWDAGEIVEELVTGALEVEADQLADPGIPLADAARRAAASNA
jgi:3-phenylpropionate/trans-cinnamate dioxygenase ferredoxin reductase subunit